MAFEATNPTLFGLDLSTLVQTLRRGWDGLRRWPLLAWLSPAEPVLAHWPDGSRRLVLGASNRPAPTAGPAALHALVLPPELVLGRQLQLPHLADAEVEAALYLELQAESPFPVADLDWGWRLDRVDEAGLTVTLAFAARKHVDRYLETDGAGLPADCEIWADVEGPVPLLGRGAGPRLARVRARRRRILLLAALNAALLAVLTAAPYWQLRQRTIDAQRQLQQLEQASGGYLEARAALVAAEVQRGAVDAWLANQADMPALLHQLTELLPDTAYLNRFDAEGRRVRITGSAADGAGLMDLLRAEPRFQGLRALSPIVRGREGLDTFYLEFELRPGPAAPTAETAPAGAAETAS